MPSRRGVCTSFVIVLLVACAYGAAQESLPPDFIDIDPAQGAVVAGTIGPDVIVSLLHTTTSNHGSQDPSGSGDYISAFSIGTTSCNLGDQDIDWFENTNQHPAIHQSMYRLRDSRFEQIGMSWIKHGFYALNNPSTCGLSCTVPVWTPESPVGTRLGVGCSDPYTAGLNANRSYLGPTWEINAHSGAFVMPHSTAPATTAAIPNRLQVHNYDLNPALNTGAVYFVQGHYVHPDDAFFGNGNNNASYARVTIVQSGTNPNFYNILSVGATQQMQSALRAWKDNDPAVVETDAQVPGEGLFILSAKATDRGDGYFHYEYALQNLNSDRSGGSFAVQLPVGVVIPPESIDFHDVDYHDGDGPECPGCVCTAGVNVNQPCNQRADCPSGQCSGPNLNYDGTDWEATVEVGKITWATVPYDIDPNANALRWSTLYNFRFDANVGPDNTIVTLGMFKPGSPSEVPIQTIGPRVGLIDCNHNGIPDACDVDCAGIGCTAYPECGGSLDCAIDANGDGNGVPDECEFDCQPNGFPDACDIFAGRSEDCQLPNGNTVPDECEADCDGDDIPDTCETVTDTDGDGVDDCNDLCLETTPVNACVPRATVNCCFCASPVPLCVSGYPRDSCLSNDGTPICSEPPTCSGTVCPESQCRDGCIVGDFDRDGDLDLFDVAALQDCFSASIGDPAYVVPSAECLLRFDFDNDGDVDGGDYNAFFEAREAYPGP